MWANESVGSNTVGAIRGLSIVADALFRFMFLIEATDARHHSLCRSAPSSGVVRHIRYERNEPGQVGDREQSPSFHQLSGSGRPTDDPDHLHAGGVGGSQCRYKAAALATVRWVGIQPGDGR